jgi:8-oxo-dGTP pyrophosphatase MutT (NUDIX family)
MTPGGKLEESKDDTPFAGMMREFQEETNVNFPIRNSEVIDLYRWKDTMVYVVMMNHRFPSVFEKTKETVAMRFVHFSRLDTMHNLKHYVGKSFRELNIGGLITRRLTR